MRKTNPIASTWLALSLLAPAIRAQMPASNPPTVTHVRGDISGDWQGIYQADKPLRIIIKIAKGDKGWTAKLFSIDRAGGQSLNATTISLDGSSFKFTVDLVGISFNGTVSSDGNSIAGTWTEGPTPQAFTFVRATKETAWEIPAPPPPPKLMAEDANPAFDVATIKPNNSGAAQMQGLNVNGRKFTTRNSSLGDLISFAYDLQAKQILGAPDWMDKDRFDIEAVPDQEGIPSPRQLKTMIQKLIAERFHVTFHHEKKELSAYVLTVSKNGHKLAPTELKGPLPGIGFRPQPGGLRLSVRNGTVDEFTGFLQTLVLDRPVVDHTALAGRYDFSFSFTPDDSQFNGHPPPLPASTDTTVASPNLFEAMQQQLGLKLEAAKTPVDVVVLDHVERYSAN